MEDQFTSYVEFENEDGETISLAIYDYFEYEDDMYAILMNEEGSDEETDEVEVCVLKVIKNGENGENEEFVEPDEDKIPDLQYIVEQILADDCECGEDGCGCGCGDDDCECGEDDCECGEDDCGCGCGEHHHH